jgi:hypothetical protein
MRGEVTYASMATESEMLWVSNLLMTPGESRFRRESAGDISWLLHEFLVGSGELTRSAYERALLFGVSGERPVMFSGKRFGKPFREAIGEHRDKPADE